MVIMNIKFANKTIMHLCNTERVMLSKYGQNCTNILKKRLLQLFAAEYLGIFLPPGSKPLKCTSHTDASSNLFRLPLHEKHILIFESIDGRIQSGSSNLDWNTIRTIMIHNIEKISHV